MMKREIIEYKGYSSKFLSTLDAGTMKKVKYVMYRLESDERIDAKLCRKIAGVDGLFELRIAEGGNIYRIFFIFDKGNIVVLFNGFQKKSEKTPKREIEIAKQLMKSYYAEQQKFNERKRDDSGGIRRRRE